jgi:hypothetical protein
MTTNRLHRLFMVDTGTWVKTGAVAGSIIRRDLNWADHVNYTLRKAWKALHFVIRILKKENSNTKHLAYTALVRPILEYGAVCWDPYRDQTGALNWVQRWAAKFANDADQTGWESFAECRMVSRLCAPFKAYTGRRLGKLLGADSLRPCYLSREDHNRKIRSGKQRTGIGKYSFVNRTVINWNQLPADLLASFSGKLNTFRKRVKKVVTHKWIRWGLTVNTCIYCVLFVWLLIILGTYFIVLGMYYCMFIVLGTYYCMFSVVYVLLYCAYFLLHYVRIILYLLFIVLCCTTV